MIKGGKLFAGIPQKLYNFASVPWFGSCFLQTDNFTHRSRAKILFCPEEDTELHCQSAAQLACLSLSRHSDNTHDIFISYGKSKTECLQFNCSPKNYKCTFSYYSSNYFSKINFWCMVLVEETGKPNVFVPEHTCWDLRISHPEASSQAELVDWVLNSSEHFSKIFSEENFPIINVTHDYCGKFQ